jgi:hypothetical protein
MKKKFKVGDPVCGRGPSGKFAVGKIIAMEPGFSPGKSIITIDCIDTFQHRLLAEGYVKHLTADLARDIFLEKQKELIEFNHRMNQLLC